ncbi:hypothetical protein EDC04DRAFT_2612483 [Pisolithus marmoratus]|nr:hypothetical protein EDC04DRAFT_2612483 [Pisolithus marmoratus]
MHQIRTRPCGLARPLQLLGKRVNFTYRTDLILSRNLCAIDWCKEHKGGTVGEFSEYWDTLVRNNDLSVDNYKRQAAMVKEMRKKVLESTSPVVASEHAFEGYRDV